MSSRVYLVYLVACLHYIIPHSPVSNGIGADARPLAAGPDGLLPHWSSRTRCIDHDAFPDIDTHVGDAAGTIATVCPENEVSLFRVRPWNMAAFLVLILRLGRAWDRAQPGLTDAVLREARAVKTSV